MSKKVTFLTFFPIAFLSNPFSGYFDFPSVGRPVNYFHMEFGRNRLVNKNVRARGLPRNRKLPFLGRSDLIFSTAHRRHRGCAAHNLPIKFGENRLVNKNFSFVGVVRPLFSKFLAAT
jgi:hypothetical protein